MEAFPLEQTLCLLRDLDVEYVFIHTQGFQAEKDEQMKAMFRAYLGRLNLKAKAERDFLYG